MLYFIYSGLFVFGAIIGSFLNVLADRLPKGQNPWRGRSHCDHCRKTLQSLDLVPLISFAFLRGRCRYCHKKLSLQYPLVELLTGSLYVFLFYYFGSTNLYGLDAHFLLLFASLLVVFSTLIVIFISDVKYQIIPDEMSLVLVGSAALWVFSSEVSWLQHVVSAICAAAFFYAIYLLTHKRGMGFGDVKLSFGLGLWLGFPRIITGLYVAFLTGGLLSLILLISKRKHLGQKIAFGPFLIIGAIASFFVGNRLWSWFFGGRL